MPGLGCMVCEAELGCDCGACKALHRNASISTVVSILAAQRETVRAPSSRRWPGMRTAEACKVGAYVPGVAGVSVAFMFVRVCQEKASCHMEIVVAVQ